MENKAQFLEAIKDASTIIISTHLFPDADGIGSQISLAMALQKIGKSAICVNEEPLLERYHYLDPKRVVLGLDDYKKLNEKKAELVIVVDTNTLHRTGPRFKKYAESLKSKLLFIDHHPCDTEVQEHHCINTKAAATGQLVGDLIDSLGVKFDKELSLPLYTAILIDTSSFRYPTVTGDTHRMIGKLMDAGVKAPMAYNGIYGTKKVSHMHILGKVLLSAESELDGKISWICLKKEDLDKYHTDIEDTHAYINHLLVMDNLKVACMFREDEEHIKLSLRSTGEYDVGKIAIGLGGGGHSHSAATILDFIDGSFDKTIKCTIEKIKKIMTS